MSDIQIKPTMFQSTQVVFQAVSEAGADYLASLYGPGACEVTIRKSWVGKFIHQASLENISIGWRE